MLILNNEPIDITTYLNFLKKIDDELQKNSITTLSYYKNNSLLKCNFYVPEDVKNLFLK